jgi:hypothetical protein
VIPARGSSLTIGRYIHRRANCQYRNEQYARHSSDDGWINHALFLKFWSA